jgi:hypothetical protein
MSLILRLFGRVEHLDRMPRHDGGYGVLVDKLRVAIAPQEHTKIIEPAHNALKLDAVHQKNGEGNFIFPDEIEKSILQVGSAFDRHGWSCSVFLGRSAKERIFWRCYRGLKPVRAASALCLIQSQARFIGKFLFLRRGLYFRRPYPA